MTILSKKDSSHVQCLHDLVGNTPLLEIKHKRSDTVKLVAKCEWYNPSGSVKDRAAFLCLNML